MSERPKAQREKLRCKGGLGAGPSLGGTRTLGLCPELEGGCVGRCEVGRGC